MSLSSCNSLVSGLSPAAFWPLGSSTEFVSFSVWGRLLSPALRALSRSSLSSTLLQKPSCFASGFRAEDACLLEGCSALRAGFDVATLGLEVVDFIAMMTSFSAVSPVVVTNVDFATKLSVWWGSNL